MEHGCHIFTLARQVLFEITTIDCTPVITLKLGLSDVFVWILRLLYTLANKKISV
jgi:hypothetical protein